MFIRSEGDESSISGEKAIEREMNGFRMGSEWREGVCKVVGKVARKACTVDRSSSSSRREGARDFSEARISPSFFFLALTNIGKSLFFSFNVSTDFLAMDRAPWTSRRWREKEREREKS